MKASMTNEPMIQFLFYFVFLPTVFRYEDPLIKQTVI